MNYNTYIIAEIGINHEGNYSLCKEMVYAAKEAGVKAIKLQTIDPDKNYLKNTESYKIFSQARLSKTQTEDIFNISKKLNLDIFTTVGDVETADWIKSLNPSAWKISSSLLTHTPLISHIASFKERMFLSTGLADYKEIDDAVKILKKKRKVNYNLLHCVSKYPTKSEEINLSRIQLLNKKYKVKIGYSDHSQGILASCLAVSRGASIIEKHFTYDSKREGFDHNISLDYKGMLKLVESIIETEKMLKNNVNSENIIRNNRKKFLRVIVSNNKILKGEKFTKSNLSIKRTKNNENGISPSFYNKLLGKEALKNYKKDFIITKSEFKND